MLLGRRQHQRRPERGLRDHRLLDGLRRAVRRDDEERRPRRAVAGARARRRRRPVHPRRRRVRGRQPGARLRRRGDGAVPVRHHADARPDRARAGPQQHRLGLGRPGRASCCSACCRGPSLDFSGKDTLPDRRPDARPRRSPTTCCRRTSCRSSPSRSSSSPPPSAPSSWPGRTEPACSLGQLPAARRGAVLHRRVRRPRPAQRGDGADVGRADPQRGQPQLHRLRPDARQRRRAGVRPLRHRRRRRRGRRRPRHGAARVPQPSLASPSTSSAR